MKRLTIMTEKGAALKMASTYPSEDAARKDLMQRYRLAVDRLAEYEDTGMTPKEIRELKGLWKVVCKLYGINAAGLSINNPLTLEELREMDGEPVWVKEKQQYGILKVAADRFMVAFDPFEYSTALFVQMGNQIGDMTFYRSRPEEGTE